MCKKLLRTAKTTVAQGAGAAFFGDDASCREDGAPTLAARQRQRP